MSSFLDSTPLWLLRADRSDRHRQNLSDEEASHAGAALLVDGATPMELPCAVGIQFDIGGRIEPGLLLEWKQAPDKRGRMLWWGLVAYARPSVAHPAIPFTMLLEWVPSTSIVRGPRGRMRSGRNAQ